MIPSSSIFFNSFSTVGRNAKGTGRAFWNTGFMLSSRCSLAVTPLIVPISGLKTHNSSPLAVHVQYVCRHFAVPQIVRLMLGTSSASPGGSSSSMLSRAGKVHTFQLQYPAAFQCMHGRTYRLAAAQGIWNAVHNPCNSQWMPRLAQGCPVKLVQMNWGVSKFCIPQIRLLKTIL